MGCVQHHSMGAAHTIAGKAPLSAAPRRNLRTRKVGMLDSMQKDTATAPQAAVYKDTRDNGATVNRTSGIRRCTISDFRRRKSGIRNYDDFSDVDGSLWCFSRVDCT